DQCRPVATVLAQSGGDVAWHALGIEIEQRQRRLSFAVDDVGAGARDDVRSAAQFLLADDLHRIREAGPERAKGNGFVWPQPLDQSAEIGDATNVNPAR